MTTGSSDHSIRKEVTIIISLLTNVASLVAMVSNSWAVPANKDFSPSLEGLGLWKYCRYTDDIGVDDMCYNTVQMETPGWFKTTQALVTIGFVLMILSFFMIVISQCAKTCRKNATLLLAYIVFTLMSAVLSGAGIIVFGGQVEGYTIIEDDGDPLVLKVGWSFMVGAVGVCINFICGVFGICEMIYSPNMRPILPTLQLHSNGAAQINLAEIDVPDNFPLPVDQN